MENTITNNNADLPPSATPVVLLLIDGWGIAPASEANAIFATKTPTLSNLIRQYPVALLSPENKTLNARYLSLGAGSDLDDENEVPATTLTKVLSDNKISQLKITETERLAALTHFFNGHQEKLMYEDWKIVSSEAGDHSVKPTLALNRISRELSKAIKSEKYKFIVAAIPTLDLVAASGDLKAIRKAAELVDKNIKQIVAAIADKEGVLLVSSSAGNVEYMKNMATELIDVDMTNNPVPLIIVGEEYRGKTIGLSEPVSDDLSLLAPAGSLGDLSPTILAIMGLSQPAEMRGESLIDKG